jgi:hypothetical protein
MDSVGMTVKINPLKSICHSTSRFIIKSNSTFCSHREFVYFIWISDQTTIISLYSINPYPTAFPYGNGMVLHFYQQQESSTTKTVYKVIKKGLKTYV